MCWPYRYRSLVSMATYSSHKVIMGGNGVATFSQLFLIPFFILADKDDIRKSLDKFEIRSYLTKN